jgi:hypothetical protein
MLPEMILPVKGPGCATLLFAAVVVVCIEMFPSRVDLVTVDALLLSIDCGGDDFAERCADPLLQTQMQ